MITRGVRRQNKARREFLREPRDGLIVFGNACNSVANTKKFFEALAGFPAFAETFAQAAQVSRHLPRRLRRLREAPGIYRDVCAGCASSTAFTETFAQAARGSRHLPRRLRRLREVPGICRDVCAGCARLPAFAETFAGLPQTPKSFSGHLQRSCKHQKVFRGSCSVAAKPSPGARRLMLSSNSRIEEAEAVCDGGYLWRRFQTMTDEKMDYGCDDRMCDGGKRTGV